MVRRSGNYRCTAHAFFWDKWFNLNYLRYCSDFSPTFDMIIVSYYIFCFFDNFFIVLYLLLHQPEFFDKGNAVEHVWLSIP